MSYRRASVVMVDLEPVAGSEQGRVRPCIVASDLDSITASRSRPLYVIVPLTRSEKLVGALAPRLTARAGALPTDSTALVMHLRSIDPRRISRAVGMLSSVEMQAITRGIKALFKLDGEGGDMAR